MDTDPSRIQAEADLLGEPSLRVYLDDFALRAGRHLGADLDLSISLRHAGRDRLAASTSDRAARCDEVEYATGAGPCITAMDLLQVVLVPDAMQDTRWESWRRATLDEGYRSGAGVPAHVAEGVEVVLNLYSERVDPWHPDLLLRADTFAQQVAVTVGLCLQVAQLSAAVADARAAVTESQRLGELVVGALAADERSADGLLRRVREAGRDGGREAQEAVRAILRDAGTRDV